MVWPMGLPVWQRGIQYYPQQVSYGLLECSLPWFDVHTHLLDEYICHKAPDVEHD